MLNKISTACSRLVWWLLSVPIFIKILGICTAIAWLFGVVVLVQTHRNMSRILDQLLKQKAISAAWSMAEDFRPALAAGDLGEIAGKIQRIQDEMPDVHYLLVCDERGALLAQLRADRIPVEAGRDLPPAKRRRNLHDIRVASFSQPEGLLYDALCPLPDGGTLQLGILDPMVNHELSRLAQSIIWTFVLCVAVGTCLALCYTYFIVTRPIHHLVQVVRGISEGDFRGRAKIFSGDEIGRLSLAFNQMGESLERTSREIDEKEKARLALLDKIVEAQEEERKTISRELHDQIGQSLLALQLALQTDYASGGITQPMIEDLTGRIRRLIGEVRHLAWGMRPSILDDYGLDQALQRYTQNTAKQYGLEIDYHYSRFPGQDRLPGRIEVTLYRVVQEAIANIRAHAHATRASIVLIHQHDQILLLVEDNGDGFNVSETTSEDRKSLGLRGMEERAALHGGTCVYESVHGQGTTIRVTIPLKGDAA